MNAVEAHVKGSAAAAAVLLRADPAFDYAPIARKGPAWPETAVVLAKAFAVVGGDVAFAAPAADTAAAD